MNEFLCSGQILCEPVYYASAFLPFLLVFIIPLYFYFTGDKQKSKISVLAFFVALGVSEALKMVFNIPRPYGLGKSPSFPSSHASLAFCETRIMRVNKVVFAVGLIAGLITAFGRVYTGFHTWYDVVGGSVLGYFIGDVVIKMFTKYSRAIFHRK